MTPLRAFGFIVLLCLVVYFPSLFHVARGDQMNYLAEVATRDDQSWVRLALRDFNFNRMRSFAPGDEQLFRPGLYFMLGTEKFLFGYDFKLWQAVGLLCHLVVVWWLLKLAWYIRPGYLGAGCVAVFSVMTAHMEMVIWHHISAYMVFLTLVLITVYHLLVYAPVRGKEHVRVCALALGLAVLFYEAALVFMFFALVYAFWVRMERKHFYALLLAFMLIAAGYLGWSMATYGANGASPDLLTGVIVKAFSWETFRHTLMALGWWFYAGLLPLKAELSSFSRMMAMGIYHPWVKECLMLVAALGVAVVIAGFFCWNRSKRFLPRHGKLVALMLAMIIAVAGIIAAGRMNMQEAVHALAVATYYGYFFWAFMVIVIVAFVDDVLSAGPMCVDWRWVTAILLVVLLGVNAWGTFRKNIDYANGSRELIRLSGQMESFIRQHEREEGFSFFVPSRWPNYEITWLLKKNEPVERRYSFVEVLFPKYFRRDKPRYLLQ